jgi:hypothetical protein
MDFSIDYSRAQGEIPHKKVGKKTKICLAGDLSS